MTSSSSPRALRRQAGRRASALLAGAVLTVPTSALLAGSAYAERGPAVVTVKGPAAAAATAGHRAPATSTATIAQPLSHADQNTGGANPGTTSGCGAYCSSGVGLPTGNGVGDGTAVGQPCAGCVGKADNKNPAGQAPSGPVDANAGYECDRNQGIGKTNPAHTGCATVKTAVLPPVVTPPVVNPPVVTPPKVTPPVVTPPVVGPPSGVTPAAPVFGGGTGGPATGFTPQAPVPAAPVPGAPAAPTALPFTGDATATALTTGALLVLTGAGLVAMTRRRVTS